MIVTPSTELKNFDGTPLLSSEKKPVLLRTVLINSLAIEDPGLPTTIEQKMRAYVLSMQLTKDETVELESDDIVFLKQRLHKIYTPLIFGQVVNLLEGKGEKSA